MLQCRDGQKYVSIFPEKLVFIKEYIGLIDTARWCKKIWQNRQIKYKQRLFLKSFPLLTELTDQENLWENIMSNGPRIYSSKSPHSLVDKDLSRPKSRNIHLRIFL